MRVFDHSKMSCAMSAKRGAITLAIVCLTGLPCGASVMNGNFDMGLTGWTTEGDVEGVMDASLGDDGTDYSALYQAVALAAGSCRIEFDFLNLISPDLPADVSALARARDTRAARVDARPSWRI